MLFTAPGRRQRRWRPYGIGSGSPPCGACPRAGKGCLGGAGGLCGGYFSLSFYKNRWEEEHIFLLCCLRLCPVLICG